MFYIFLFWYRFFCVVPPFFVLLEFIYCFGGSSSHICWWPAGFFRIIFVVAHNIGGCIKHSYCTLVLLPGFLCEKFLSSDLQIRLNGQLPVGFPEIRQHRAGGDSVPNTISADRFAISTCRDTPISSLDFLTFHIVFGFA